jgi:bifunctional non-homologous end joining protein LigD
VVVPLAAEDAWDIVRDFARSIAEQMQWDVPDAYIANMSKKKRAGKIFIDFFRNDFSATAIVPFSIRARAGAPLAWPVSWAGLEKLQGANHYRLQSLSPSDIRTTKALVKKDPVLS